MFPEPWTESGGVRKAEEDPRERSFELALALSRSKEEGGKLEKPGPRRGAAPPRGGKAETFEVPVGIRTYPSFSANTLSPRLAQFAEFI